MRARHTIIQNRLKTANETVGPKRMFLLAGSPRGDGTRTLNVLRQAIAETCVSRPVVAYVGTASGDDRQFFNYLESILVQCGAGEVDLCPLVGKKADPCLSKEILCRCDMVFISGGEVEDGITGIPDDVKSLLADLRNNGTVFAGMSAGTIMLGRSWPHWNDEDKDFDNARLFDCLGFSSAIFDTHAEDDGFIELRKAVELSGGEAIGYGIPSDCALVANPDGSIVNVGNMIICKYVSGRTVLETMQ